MNPLSSTTTAGLAGLQNVRDVGGIRVPGAGRIRPGVLYRSDAPRAGDPPPGLAPWPPATVIDLRSADESQPVHPLAAAGTDVHRLALSGAASIAHLGTGTLPGGLDGLYGAALAGRGARFAEVARILAAGAAPALVHCTAGKDRTGMVVAVVLAAVGASREGIIEDYARTDANMPGVLHRIETSPDLEDGRGLIRRLLDREPELATAPARAMATVLDTLEAGGGAAAWLVDQGLDPAAVDRLRERLVEPVSAG